MKALPNIRKLILTVVPALVAGAALSGPAFSQTASPSLPSVAVRPFGTKPTDPNGGTWFVAAASPGQAVTMKAHVTNPANVPQTVSMYLADVDFNKNGAPVLSQPGYAHEVGSWGGFGNPVVTIGAGQAVDLPFTVTAPQGADPGDHIGAVVAESQPQAAPGASVEFVKKVATRLYMTVPGDAQPNVSIDKISLSKDSSFVTRDITAHVTLRNTGRVRLHPTVRVNGTLARGSSLLMTRSVEQYVATVKAPIWGGPLSYHVDVQTTVGEGSFSRPGPARTGSASTFVIPWLLLIGIAVFVGLFFLLRWVWRKRGSKYAALQADLRRFERLLDQQRAAGESTADTTHEAELAIKSAIKQAGRAGDKDTEIKLRGKLAELQEQEAAPPPPPSAPLPAPSSPAPAAAASIPQPAPVAAPAPEPVNGNGNGNGDGNGHAREDDAALAAILGMLAVAPPGGQRFSLIKAARQYGREAIESHTEELAALPEDVRVRLLRAAPRQPEAAPSEIA